MNSSLTRKEVSIYAIYSSSQKIYILVACALVAIITPFTDTVYLPSLKSVQIDLNGTDGEVAATVSVYMACVGIGQIFWGPLSDHYGRLMITYISLFFYEAFTLGCVFVTNIDQLLILRSIQGLLVASTVTVAQSIIADCFKPEERGSAMGAFLVNFNLYIPTKTFIYLFLFL